MGSFYTNVTLRGPHQEEVALVLRQHNFRAYVSPTQHGLTVISEEQCEAQNPDTLATFAAFLSRHFRCPALAVLNHDDDVLFYQLYKAGALVDEYDSTPGYFEGTDLAPRGGAAQLLCEIFGASHNVTKVAEILHLPQKNYLFALDRHTDLVQALGLPDFAVAFGFTYIEMGELPDRLARGALKFTK